MNSCLWRVILVFKPEDWPFPGRVFFLALYSDLSAAVFLLFHCYFLLPNGRNPWIAKLPVLNSICIKNSPCKKDLWCPDFSRARRTFSTKYHVSRLKSWGRIQLHGSSSPQLLFRHFDLPHSVTLSSTNSSWGGEKILQTARFLAQLPSEPLVFHLFSITFPQAFSSRAWGTEPGGLESKKEGQGWTEPCSGLSVSWQGSSSQQWKERWGGAQVNGWKTATAVRKRDDPWK